jgi:hypothetical protein
MFSFRVPMAVDRVLFKEAWLERHDDTGEKFRNWLLPNPRNNTQAICAICHWRTIDIRSGVCYLVGHTKSKQHKQIANILQEKREQNPEVSDSTFTFCSLTYYS